MVPTVCLVTAMGLPGATATAPSGPAHRAPSNSAKAIDRFFETAVSANRAADDSPRQAAASWLTLAEPKLAHPWAAVGLVRAAQFHHGSFGEYDRARVLYERALAAPGADPVRSGCRVAARRGLARLDLRLVRLALRAYYADRVRYPKRLAEAASAGLLDARLLSDRWGEPLRYQAAPSSLFADSPDQEYTLASARLGAKAASARQVLERQAFLDKRLKIIASAVGADDGRVQARVLYDPHDGVHKKRTLTAAVGGRILDLSVAWLGERGAILVADDAIVVLPIAVRAPTILVPPKPKPIWQRR